MLRINRPVDRGGKHDAATLLQAHESVGPCGIVGCEGRAGDRDQAAAFGQSRQRRCDVAQSRVGHAPIDMGDRRERRVHQHDARDDAGIEMIVDLRGVEACRGGGGKEPVENAGSGVGKLVKSE